MNFKKALIYLYKQFENIVFPQCCLICGKLSEDIWCEKCKKEMLKEKKFIIEENKQNKKCYFESHIYFFQYKDNIRKLILDYKFNDKSYLYKIFSEIITKNKKTYRILKKYDIITPVPIHRKRKKQRGYNQSYLIAKEISININTLILENKILKKTKNNIEQSSLKKEQRAQNVKNVYVLEKSEKIKNKNIVLFDDIYTTGNTVNEISRILKENGANKILILTIAKD
ncbi:MAG: ComF family protein [Clostridiaceae bacterium]|nr:ComF family protein [Clostridiaceae bacterium]